jgi:hypothetical protein
MRTEKVKTIRRPRGPFSPIIWGMVSIVVSGILFDWLFFGKKMPPLETIVIVLATGIFVGILGVELTRLFSTVKIGPDWIRVPTGELFEPRTIRFGEIVSVEPDEEGGCLIIKTKSGASLKLLLGSGTESWEKMVEDLKAAIAERQPDGGHQAPR